jgi:trimethylamine--corrinoid protein Co-methyltransferase
MIYGSGMLELGVTFDYAQLLIDNEIARMVNKVVEGIPVTDETLAVDVIKEVGSSGEFITKEHTYKYFREQSQSKLIDRRMREAWLDKGAKDLTTRAYEEAIHILETYKPEPLPEGVQEKLRKIVEEAEDEYGLKKK